MTLDEFFAEAKRLNLRVLGTPEETRAALDLKDAEIARLTAALKQANGQAEHFEREWYLRGDEVERLRQVWEDTRTQRDELLAHLTRKEPLPAWAVEWIRVYGA